MLIRFKIALLYIFSRVEFIKIISLSSFFGSDYAVKSLSTCRKDNIEKILKHYGARIGKNNHFKGGLIIDNAQFRKRELFINLSIGNNCYIGTNVYLDLANQIEIEDSVVIGAKATIVTHSDVGNRAMQKYFSRVSKRVLLQESCWIGVNATLLAGVTVGKFSVVGASSLVTKSINKRELVFGVPAKKQREIG